MGKTFSVLLRPPPPPQPREQPRESEMVMELRKRPRPQRSTEPPPPPPPPRKRARRQVAPKPPMPPKTPPPPPPPPSPPRKRGRCAGGGGGGGAAPEMLLPRKRLSPCTSPRATFLAPHSNFNWYEQDIWTEVAKLLEGKDLVRLGTSDRWFQRLVSDDSIWRHAFLRDLAVPPPPPCPLRYSWRGLYTAAFDGSHSYCFRQPEKHLDWLRIGGFYLDSPLVLLTEKLSVPRRMPPPAEGTERAIQLTGACVLSNARTGIWIADLQLVRCPVCNLNSCEGTMQVLDARHAELFLEAGYKDGRWEYENIGEHRIEEQCAAAVGAIFDAKHLSCESTACVLNAKSWIGQREDLQPKARITTHAVAVNTNLQPNEGLQVRFQAMRDTTGDGKVVSIRISQQLI